MKKIVFIVLLLVSFQYAFSQTSTKEKKVKELLELTGAAKLGTQMAHQLFSSFEKSFKSVPAEFWEKLKTEINIAALTDMVIPVYVKYYTEEELEQLIQFYKTPLGKKVIAVMPQVMQESMEIGEKWGEKAAEKIMNELDQKGYKRDEA